MKTIENKVASHVKDHEPIINDSPKMHEAFGVGDVSHQGDIIIVGISSLPKSAKQTPNRQLAVGRTQGSRHILDKGSVYECDKGEISKLIEEATGCVIGAQYIGPVFVSPDNPTCDDLTHPEHGNQGFPSGQVCSVVYQRSLDAEEREQRVKD